MCGNTVILRQFDAWFEPDLHLAIRRFYVHVHAIFFSRVEKVSVPAVAKDCWTHAAIVPLGRHHMQIEELKRVGRHPTGSARLSAEESTHLLRGNCRSVRITRGTVLSPADFTRHELARG